MADSLLLHLQRLGEATCFALKMVFLMSFQQHNQNFREKTDIFVGNDKSRLKLNMKCFQQKSYGGEPEKVRCDRGSDGVIESRDF